MISYSVMKSYSDLTLKLTKNLSKSEKKEFGFFVTPPSITNTLIEKTHIHTTNVSRILEPSCGSCEIVSALINTGCYSNVVIDAIEYNKTVYDAIKDIEFGPSVNIIHQDFLKYEGESGTYDLIIGNPPYFVMAKDDVPKKYQDFVVGRPNIFGIFIIHAISMLSEGGVLSFIIPKSFLNAAYYSKIRDYIRSNCTILNIIDFENNNDFLETQQATLGLIIQKKICSEECKFSIKLGNHYVFTENADRLKRLFEGSSTLKQMEFSVKTGNVVWNQHKSKLTSDNTKTLLIYNTNIEGSEIVEKSFNNDEKKQYIDMDGQTGTVLVVNRGNGNSAYKLTYSLVQKPKYLVENHLNVIVYNGTEDPVEKYNQIIRSFKDPRTADFINTFLGNNGLSKSELESIFPIY
jgi:adenine-specific DNA-methyltransferase